MKHESLDGLKAAFAEWRSKKQYPREAIPTALLERARRAARHHGPAAVARVAKMDSGRLKGDGRGRRARRAETVHVPTYSRVEIASPAATRPFAELEMATGVKVRLYAQTDEVLALLSLFISGGAQ